MRHFIKIIVMASLTTAALAGNAGAQDFRSPDARSTDRPVAVTDVRSPDARETSGVSTYEPGVPARQTVLEVAAPEFQWGDAGIGAAAMLGVIALFAGTLLLAGSRRRNRHAIG